MKNEPVAWMETYKGEPNNLDWDKSNLNYGSEFHDVVPLYTHPVKEPTDEEILHQNLIWGQQNGEDYSMLTVEDIEPLISLIRAILRKESERWTKNEYEPPDFFFMENDLMGKR